MANLSEEMEANALEAQRFSRKHMVLELDFSELSIQEMESSHVDTLDYAIQGGLSDENVEMLSRIWGAYIGETLRKECGGEWIEVAGKAGLTRDDITVYPQEQVRLRLTAGQQHDLAEFYRQSKRQLSES